MTAAEIVGLIGGALTTFGFVPQVVRVLRLKSAHEISLVFTVLFTIGCLCWLAYGLLARLPVVILWNAIASLLAFILLYAKMKYGRHLDARKDGPDDR